MRQNARGEDPTVTLKPIRDPHPSLYIALALKVNMSTSVQRDESRGLVQEIKAKHCPAALYLTNLVSEQMSRIIPTPKSTIKVQ